MSTNSDYTTNQIVSGKHSLLIDGLDVEAISGDRFTRSSPAHGIEVGSYANASTADVDAAVRAARNALESGWRISSGAVRSKLLSRGGHGFLSGMRSICAARSLSSVAL